jgi:hypothetical protein
VKVLFVHPSPLMYSEIYLRLEPLGLELVAAAARRAGHDVRLLDLQVFKHPDYFRLIESWKPEAIGFSLNYLANIPEVIDLAKETNRKMPLFVCRRAQRVVYRERNPEACRWRARLRGAR